MWIISSQRKVDVDDVGNFLLTNSRKTSPIEQLFDVMHRLLERSDPLINDHVRNNTSKKLCSVCGSKEHTNTGSKQQGHMAKILDYPNMNLTLVLNVFLNSIYLGFVLYLSNEPSMISL